MRYIRQVLIIILISFIGELLNYYIPLPIPANIYGMVILFILLCLGIVKIEHIKETGNFLLDIMPMLFIPSAVGIMSSFNMLRSIWLEIIIITIATTALVIAVTGIVTQKIISHHKRKNKK